MAQPPSFSGPIGPHLELRQAQTLVMTPQLQQAIKLLQMSNLDLGEFVAAEMERNPLLTSDEAEAGRAEDIKTTDFDPGAVSPYEGTPAPDVVQDSTAAESLDVDYDNQTSNSLGQGDGGEAWGQDAGYSVGSGGRSDFSDDDGRDWEQAPADGQTLLEHLTSQLNMTITDPKDRLIGSVLIALVDEAGYLSADLTVLAVKLGCDIERVEAVLKQLQGFDPTGIFARSLKECLALQLAERDRLDPAMQTLLDNLEMLAKRDLPGLIKLCGVDAEDMAEMIQEIRSLNPKPALLFSRGEAVPVVIPDVLTRRDKSGQWSVELNADTLPRVLVNHRYYTTVATQTKKREDKTYFSACLQSANWLVRALDQRATTILKVAAELVQAQEGFFNHGITHLKPMVLRDVAEKIDMHESTISRVTNHKYIATPWGVFELKYFFTQAIASGDGGEAHSAEAVRHRIKTLIDNEGKKVLSDDKIVAILQKEGMDIARRTVAKYREAMKIPSSVQRRRDKAMP